MKTKGLKKAVGDYQRANSKGYYSPWYGILMYDTADGEIWTDTFYSLGHNERKEYKQTSIVNLSNYMAMLGLSVTMENVKKVIEDPNFLKRYQASLNCY